ncbi:hypothetical protein WV34_15245 [Bacillus amyloliquefaciens]|uniref:hypothetical protein n=1 Tax=Bacillus amyloliquefaciens group TaxID=1938374 RepID=UPI000B51B4D0|nr:MULTISPECIES: hypothetical protein [Bacillus amyloliquefaciens group]ASF30033.1 hypothetical protein WV34_15245 [Bacillus amyloliquefaciens]UZD73455.1 hypothetical protein OM992_17070 [Bacillus siamensis]
MKLGKIIKFLLGVCQFIRMNLHTLFFLIGLFVIDYGIFLLHPTAGLIVAGLFLVLIAFLLNPREEGGR